ncbi:MAG TPA: class I SAM-dependent methyltransferase [Anaerolineales bacterium]
MDHRDHVELLRAGIQSRGGRWADLGAGGGAFTLALRELAGPEAEIHAVDRDRRALEELRGAYSARFGGEAGLSLHAADLSGKLELPALDGIVMANSLHFFRDKLRILRHVRGMLKPEGRLLVVEYNVDRGNVWVPYPVSWEAFQGLAPQAGFTAPRLLARHPSSFLKEFYSAETGVTSA